MKPTKIIMGLLLLMALLSVLALSSCGKNDKKVKPDPNEQVVEENSAGSFVEGSENNEDPDTGKKDQRIDILDDSLAVDKADIERLKGKESKNTSWIPLLIAVIALGALVWLLIAINDLKGKIIPKEFKKLSEMIKKIEGTEKIHTPTYSHGVQVASKSDDSMTRGMLEDIRGRLDRITQTNGAPITKEHLEKVITAIYNDCNQELVSTIKNDMVESQSQTLDFVSDLEKEIANLKQEIGESRSLSEKILARVDAANDDRFLSLRLYFRDVSEDLQKAFLMAEKLDHSFQTSMGDYVDNFSKLVNLQKLSGLPADLDHAYEALRDIFRNIQITWILPKPGDVFDPDQMEQHKRVGDYESVNSVLVPGYELGESKRKALVDVG